MTPDFIDFLKSLLFAQVRFLVVGAHALSAREISRATDDMDIWFDRERDIIYNICDAIINFGGPYDSLAIVKHVLLLTGIVIQFFMLPGRNDVLMGIFVVNFLEAWQIRFVDSMYGIDIPFLGRVDYIKNKRLSGRLSDVDDI